MMHSKDGSGSLDLAYRPNPAANSMGKSIYRTSSYHDPSSFLTSTSAFNDDSSSNSQPPPPLSTHPPPPALKQAVPHHHLHHVHYLRSHDLYAPPPSQSSQMLQQDPSPYLDAYDAGDLNTSQDQLAPLPLTHHQDHHHHLHHRLHHHQSSSLLLPPPPVLQQQQPSSSAAASSMDPYQDYFQTSSTGRSYAAYEQLHPSNSSSSQPELRSLGSYSSSFHDFSSRGLPIGGGGGDPSGMDSFFTASSTPLPPVAASSSSSQLCGGGGGGAGQYRSYHHDTYMPFQPSPAVLLHIRYVMESICEGMQFTDVTIVTSTDSFRAHRAILASHSSWMRQLFLLEDLGEKEEPVLVVKDCSSPHMRLMMQFFYNGEVSLSTQEDIQPLKDVCFMLGVSSLMARLDELSFSLQCLPNNYDDPFRYGGMQQGHHRGGAEEVEEDEEEVQQVYLGKQQVFRSCAKENVKGSSVARLRQPASLHSMPSLHPPPPDVVTNSQPSNNFDTSLLDDNIGGGGEMQEGDEMHNDKSNDLMMAVDSGQAVAAIAPTMSDGGGARVKKKAFSCSSCAATFFTQESLIAHERVHEGKKPYSCKICDNNFSTKSHLQTHLRKHSGERPFCCPVCKKSFLDRSAFNRHVLIHKEKKNFQCEVCKKDFSDGSTCKRHFKEKHGENSKDGGGGGRSFGCSLCKKVFHRRETLVTHVMRVHGKDLMAKRGLGGGGGGVTKKELFKKEHLDKYLLAPPKRDGKGQGKDKWTFVECPQCDMTFYKKSSMEVHLRSHTGDRPYVCELCGKKFARSNNLKLHSRIHTGEKPHVCTLDPECGKSFSDVSALRRHLRTHTGERPYDCGRCNRCFSQLGTMKAHEKNCKGRNAKDASLRGGGVGGGGGGGGGNAAGSGRGDRFDASCSGGRRGINSLQSRGLFGRRLADVAGFGAESSTTNPDMMVNSMMEDNSLSVMAGSEPPVFNTDTLDSVRASCM